MRVRLKEKLAVAIPPQELNKIYNTFDIIGNIAIIKTFGSDRLNAEIVAKQIMATHKSVKTVFIQISPVKGNHRTRKLQLLAGENKASTQHKEAGCVFSVNIKDCYFSPRLSHERLRIAHQVSPGETIVNMFAGVGCFSIIIAKTSPQTKIYSIDLNPAAYEEMVKNVQINRLYEQVIPILCDAKEIEENHLLGIADRVLMPLPELAFEYLPYAVSALKKSGGWIHIYDFEHTINKEDPTEKTKQKVATKLNSLGVSYTFANSRVVRSIGPNWYQTVLDVQVIRVPSKF